MYLATMNQALITDGVVYLAEHGSNTPHSVMIDGVIHELLDPPTLPFTAGAHPLPISEADLA